MRKVMMAAFAVTMLNSAANATLIATISSTGALPGQTYDNLNSLAVGSAGGVTSANVTTRFTGPNAGVVTGTVENSYSAPVFSNGNGTLFGDADGGDTTKYIFVGVGSTAALSFPDMQQNLGLLWGTIDFYNTLTFYSGLDGTGASVGSLTGADIIPTASVNNPHTFVNAYVNISSTQSFRSVVLTSTAAAFELDNLSFRTSQPAAAVPEPATWGMMLIGFGAVGVGLRRRQRAVTA